MHRNTMANLVTVVTPLSVAALVREKQSERVTDKEGWRNERGAQMGGKKGT